MLEQTLSVFGVSASGLTAERLRMDVIANNIANANTTRTPEGGPYVRQIVNFMPRGAAPRPAGAVNPFEELVASVVSRVQYRFPLALTGPVHPLSGEAANHQAAGVRVAGIATDPAPAKKMFDPGHPDADAEGYVSLPNVNVVKEMVDMISASRAYEANVTAINAAKSMMAKALEIGRI